MTVSTPLFSKPTFICRAIPDMIVETCVLPAKVVGGTFIVASARPDWQFKMNATSGAELRSA